MFCVCNIIFQNEILLFAFLGRQNSLIIRQRLMINPVMAIWEGGWAPAPSAGRNKSMSALWRH